MTTGESAKVLKYRLAEASLPADADPLTRAHVVRHLGDAYREAGRLSDAEPCYIEALAIYRANDRTARLDLANAVRPLAILREAQGALAEAGTLFEEARRLYAESGVPAGVAEMAEHLGEVVRHRTDS